MRRRLGFLGLVIEALGIAACATGGSIDADGGAGGGAATSDGNATSADAAATSSGQGGDPAATSSSSATTSTGPACSEQPCKLVAPQCGCGAGEQCTVDSNGDRGCAPDGTEGIGDPCSAGDPCKAGGLCVGYQGFDSACAAFCAVDDDCGPAGSLCVIEPGGLGGITLCSDGCELISNQGCKVAGLSCQAGVSPTNEPFTSCAPGGSNVANEVCADSGDCAEGYICLPTTANDDRCFAWCNVDSPNCGQLNCQGLEIEAGVPLVIGTVTYGVCTP
jgi:hypothetical protein